MEVFDANGNQLQDGDSIQPIKDLKVKGSSTVIKAGTAVKNIKLIEGNDKEVEGKVSGSKYVLELQYFKKRKKK